MDAKIKSDKPCMENECFLIQACSKAVKTFESKGRPKLVRWPKIETLLKQEQGQRSIGLRVFLSFKRNFTMAVKMQEDIYADFQSNKFTILALFRHEISDFQWGWWQSI